MRTVGWWAIGLGAAAAIAGTAFVAAGPRQGATGPVLVGLGAGLLAGGAVDLTIGLFFLDGRSAERSVAGALLLVRPAVW